MSVPADRAAQDLYALPLDAPDAERQRLIAEVARLADEALPPASAEVLALVVRVRDHEIGSGRAAELAGMPLAIFLRLLGREGVSVFDYEEGL